MPNIEMNYLGEMFVKIFRLPQIKIIIGMLLGALSFLYDKVYVDAMIAILILIVFDFITGVMSQKKNGHPIESSKIFRTSKKIVVYFLIISAGFLSETATQRAVPILDETLMGFLAITELISILENVGYMGFAVPKKLLNQLNKIKNNK